MRPSTLNRISIAAMASATALMVCASAASAAGLQNGSFENGVFADNTGNNAEDLNSGSTTIDDWTVTSGQIQWTNTANGYNNIQASNGTYFLDLTGTSDTPNASGQFGGVTQTFDTVSGSTYNVSFDLGSSAYYDQGGAAHIDAGVTSGGSTFFGGFTYTGTLTGDQSGYQTETFSFVAASTASTLTLTGTEGLGSGQEYIGLDNVSVTQASSVSAAPEPASWALIIAGVGMIGLTFRQAKRRHGFKFANAI